MALLLALCIMIGSFPALAEEAGQVPGTQNDDANPGETCAHENTGTEYFMEDTSYTDIGEYGHTVTGTMVRYKICYDCNAKWEISREPFSQRADHSFFDEEKCVRICECL